MSAIRKEIKLLHRHCRAVCKGSRELEGYPRRNLKERKTTDRVTRQRGGRTSRENDLNGVEVAARSAVKLRAAAVLLYAVLKDQKRRAAKRGLPVCSRGGKELKVFSVNDNELEKFCREAKKYGVLYRPQG